MRKQLRGWNFNRNASFGPTEAQPPRCFQRCPSDGQSLVPQPRGLLSRGSEGGAYKRRAPLPGPQAVLRRARRVLATQMLRKQTHTASRNPSFQEKKKSTTTTWCTSKSSRLVGERGFFEGSDSPLDFCFGSTEKNLECYFCLLDKFSESISANYCH